jgi:chromosome segregation ATPase
MIDMEKTVGDILKEQGVISPERKTEQKEEVKISLFGEAKNRQLEIDIEKIKAEIQALREIKFTSDQRIKELAESIGELRSTLFQKDNLVKELEAKLKMIQDNVNEFDPKKIARQFQKQEEATQLSQIKVEKVESVYKDVYRRVEESQKILDSIKSMENLKEKVSQIEGLVSKSMENKDEVDRLTNKTEKIYDKIEGKISEIEKLKAGLEKIDDLTKEMAKSIDETSIKIAGLAKKEDIESVKNNINDLVVSNKEQMEKKFKEIDDALNIPTEEINSKITELTKKKFDVNNLLSSLEEQYRIGAVKKETFDEVKERNDSMLIRLDEEIKRLEGHMGLSIKTLPSFINELQENIKVVEEKNERMERDLQPVLNLEARTYVLESTIEIIKNQINQVGPEKMARMANAVDTQTEIVGDILLKLKEVNRRLMDAKVNLTDYENRTRFFEIMNIIVRTRNIDDISLYLSELEKLMSKLKLDKLWTEEKQYLTENLLMELSENWNEAGRDDIAKLFKIFLDRMRTPSFNR